MHAVGNLKATSGAASPKFWEGLNILIFSEQQYFFRTPPFKAQNDKIC